MRWNVFSELTPDVRYGYWWYHSKLMNRIKRKRLLWLLQSARYSPKVRCSSWFHLSWDSGYSYHPPESDCVHLLRMSIRYHHVWKVVCQQYPLPEEGGGWTIYPLVPDGQCHRLSLHPWKQWHYSISVQSVRRWPRLPPAAWCFLSCRRFWWLPHVCRLRSASVHLRNPHNWIRDRHPLRAAWFHKLHECRTLLPDYPVTYT